MKFVATKTVEQLDLQALHRVRERLVSQRTGIINQIRAFLLEPGVAIRQGLRFLRAELPRILATSPDVLSARMVRVIRDMAEDWRRLDERIDQLSSEIAVLARLPSAAKSLSVFGKKIADGVARFFTHGPRDVRDGRRIAAVNGQDGRRTGNRGRQRRRLPRYRRAR